MPYAALSLVTLHNECLKASVNIHVYNKQGPGGLGGGSGWETHSNKGERVKHSLRPSFEMPGGKGQVKSPEPTPHLPATSFTSIELLSHPGLLRGLSNVIYKFASRFTFL